MKKYIPRQKREALARRSIKIADQLELWTALLQAEMKSQNIEFWGDKDGHETMTLKRDDARRMLRRMHECLDEVRRFSS
jgi:hypothetical protein